MTKPGPRQIHEDVYETVTKHRRVLDWFDLMDYDWRIGEIEELFRPYQHQEFEKDQCIAILHFDVDYYSGGFGNTLFNLVMILARLQIPAEHVLIITNHYGIRAELDALSADLGTGRFQLLETSLCLDFPDSDEIKDVTEQEVERLYYCLNNINRSHRRLTIAWLAERELLDKGAISIS